MFLTTALLNQTVSQVPDAFRSLTHLLFGGEAANPDRVRTVLEQGKPQHLIHVYGPTENTTFSTWYAVENVPENAVTIPIGQAIANTQVYVLDKNLMPVPAGTIGEIYLGGDGLAQGYLNQFQLTTERFVEHPVNRQRLYKTGDRARYDADGNLDFLGRTDSQVKLRGFRIELGEVEAAIVQHPSVETAVVRVRELEADRQLIAYIVPKLMPKLKRRSPPETVPETIPEAMVKQSNRFTESDLRDFLKTKLPAYLLPAAVVLLDALPLTPNGKVNYRALPQPALIPIDPVIPAAAPTTSLEQALAYLWRQLLGREASIHDNFFELGGHSLLATQLVSRLRDRYQIEIPLRTVFEAPTIAALAQKIEAMSGDDLSQFQAMQPLAGTLRREEIEL
jgi:acyl-coenzyme A synthetase/AMP-(fatty) acid ligase/acyl carrier protein